MFEYFWLAGDLMRTALKAAQPLWKSNKLKWHGSFIIPAGQQFQWFIYLFIYIFEGESPEFLQEQWKGKEKCDTASTQLALWVPKAKIKCAFGECKPMVVKAV